MENFDLMAKTYDTERRSNRAALIAEEIRAHITDGHKKSALEFGCGTGLVGFEMANDFASLLLVDSSPGMITEVERKLQSLNWPDNVSALCCDLAEAVPRDLHVDYVFSSLVLHHIGDTRDILSRVYSILNENGRILIVDIDEDDGGFHAGYPGYSGHNGFEKSALIRLAEESGFINVSAKTFFHGTKNVKDREIPYSMFILDAQKTGTE